MFLKVSEFIHPIGLTTPFRGYSVRFRFAKLRCFPGMNCGSKNINIASLG